MALINKLPGVAQPAIQEGKYVGKVIRSRLKGGAASEPFKYFDKGSMATIGHRAAVAHSFNMSFTGLVAYLMWGFIHVMYLVGWGNRIGTIYTWTRALYFTKNRGQRIITYERASEKVAEGRTRLGRPNPILPRGANNPSHPIPASTPEAPTRPTL
jgi:NADH dehydrogenase